MEAAAGLGREPCRELRRAGAGDEALDCAADLHDRNAAVELRQLRGDRRECLAPRDPQHVAVLHEAGQEVRRCARNVAFDDHGGHAVALLEPAREVVEHGDRLVDLEAHDAFGARLLEQAQHLEA
jgi:hypothetical protein